MTEKRDITGYSINARLKPKKEVERKFKELQKRFTEEESNLLGRPIKLNQSEVLTRTLDVAYGAIFKGDS